MFKKQTYAKNCDVLSRSISQSGWEASLHWLPLPLFCFVFFLIWLCSIFITVCRLSLVVASRLLIVVAPRCRARALGHAGFGSCRTWAKLLCSKWNLPEPGTEPVSPASAGRLPTTGPPKKSQIKFFIATD